MRERCKGVRCVDLGESFPTSIYLQNLASIQPSTRSGRELPVPSVFDDLSGIRTAHRGYLQFLKIVRPTSQPAEGFVAVLFGNFLAFLITDQINSHLTIKLNEIIHD